MPGTFNSLALKIAAQEAIHVAALRTAPLKSFVKTFTEASAAKGTAVVVPVWGEGEAKPFVRKVNNYTGTEKGVVGREVVLDQHLVLPYYYSDLDFTASDINFWKGAGEAIGAALGRGIAGNILGLLGRDNFELEHVFTEADAGNRRVVAKLYAIAANAGIDPADAALILNPVCFAALLGELDSAVYGGGDAISRGVIPSLFGFDTVVCSGQLPKGENLNGVLVHKAAIGIAGRTLQPQSTKSLEEFATVVDPASGLALGFRRFGEAADGDNYIAGEALFGRGILQADKAVRLVSAATTPPAP